MENTFQYIQSIPYQKGEGFWQVFGSVLSSSKVVHLKDVPTKGDLMATYTRLTQGVGELVRRGEDFKHKAFTKDQWLDVRYDPQHANTYRHSNTAQPLHTDGAYIVDFDYELVFLFCKEQAPHGGATTFIDADFLYELLQEYRPRLLARLTTETVLFSKGTFGEKRQKIVDKDERGWLLNWNFYRVSKKNSPAVIQMADDFQDFLERHVVASGLLTPVKLEVGEAVFFHDRRVLHGRQAFLGNRCLIKGALNL